MADERKKKGSKKKKRKKKEVFQEKNELKSIEMTLEKCYA